MQHVTFGGPPQARGLAVLCGWSGSSLRNVRKYAELWHRLGWRTATANMTIDMTFFPGSWTPANEVAGILAKECATHRQRAGPNALVASHAFSNGGALLMLSVMQHANNGERRSDGFRFDGAVYDSAPSSRHLILPAGAPFIVLSAGLPASEAASHLVRHIPYCFLACALHAIRAPPPPIGLFTDLFDATINPPRPELFIYGEKDVLIPPEHVEAFIRERESHGSTVHTLSRLADSPHVGHLRTFPRAYEEALANFAHVLVGPQSKL